VLSDIDDQINEAIAAQHQGDCLKVVLLPDR
jgi:hypothetical protein